MRFSNPYIAATVVVLLAVSPLWAWSVTGLGAAGGWDDINKSSSVSAVLDTSDYTLDMPGANTNTALLNAFGTLDAVETAPGLNFEYLADTGGNYDVFDLVGGALDQSADWKYADIVVGGFMPLDYFDGNSGILAVTWTGQLTNGRGKPRWVSEVYFNDFWNWTDDGAAADADLAAGMPELLIDLETVALHELGHAVGLGHEDTVPAIMGSYYAGTQRELLADDIAGLEAIYAAKGGGGGGGKGGGRGKPDRMMVDGVEWMLTGVTFMDADAMSVPEPATMSLLALGTIALIRRRR